MCSRAACSSSVTALTCQGSHQCWLIASGCDRSADRLHLRSTRNPGPRTAGIECYFGREISYERAWRRTATHAEANEDYSWTTVAGITQRTYAESITQ